MKNKTFSLVIIATILAIASLIAMANKTNSDNALLYVNNTNPPLSIKNDTVIFSKTGITPKLNVNNNTEKEALSLSKLKVDVKIVGNIAITSLEMDFYNDYDRILEGELYFPLPEGYTVSGFAMELNGKLRDAVVVEKAKGRKVYESIIRRKIDPALVEMTKGNVFKTRVYPIEPKKTKKIVVKYEHELLNSSSSSFFQLPMAFEEQVDEFDIKIEVFRKDVTPKFNKNSISNFEFKNWQESFVANTNIKNYTPNSDIIVEIPKNEQNNIAYLDFTNEGTFFYRNIFPEIINTPKPKANNISIIWDVSTSAKNRNINKEAKVILDYISSINPEKVNIITFSNEVVSNIKLTGLNITDKLKNELNNLKYDGGTQLGNLNLNKIEADEFILVTDGISNFGENKIINSNKPVYTINSSSIANHTYLKHIAQSSGGRYINLTQLTEEKAASLLQELPYQFISATYNNDEIKEVYPSTSKNIITNFSIAGKLTSDMADINLNFGIGNEIKWSKTINISKEDYNDGKGIVSRIWAQKKLEQLNTHYEENKDEITKIGKKYSIVTKNTSLIVLDRIQDYVEHEITPPKELLAEYNRLVSARTKRIENETNNHLEQVVREFNARKEWWNKDFKVKPIEYKAKSSGTRHSRSLNGNVMMTDGYAVTDSTSVPSVSEPRMEYMAEEMEIAEVDMDDKSFDWSAAKSMKPNNKSVQKVKSSKIEIKEWTSDMPYILELEKTLSANLFDKYLELKKGYQGTPSFYVDVADYFYNKGFKKQAIRILSNLAELELENHELLKVLAHKLKKWKEYKLAIYVYKEVLEMREEEPQSYRDLGLAYALNNQNQEAINMLYQVIENSWDGRFNGIGLIVAGEINSIISNSKNKLNIDNIDKRLIYKMPTDIRIIIDWDADNCDIDLWVTDPRNEKCFYSNKLTKIGGKLSNDFTGGYGPEEFLLKNAITGKYKIKVNYFGSSRQRISGPPTIHARLITNYGKANEEEQEISFRSNNTKEILDIGILEFTKE